MLRELERLLALDGQPPPLGELADELRRERGILERHDLIDRGAAQLERGLLVIP